MKISQSSLDASGIRVSRMLRKVLTAVFIIIGGIVFLLLIAIVALVVYFPGRDKDHLVSESTSPGALMVAQVHSVITPMWGGPDRVEISIRHVNEVHAEVVFSGIFECSDFDRVQLKWKGSRQLQVTVVTCSNHTFKGIPSNSDLAPRLSEWQGVSITYINNEATARGS